MFMEPLGMTQIIQISTYRHHFNTGRNTCTLDWLETITDAISMFLNTILQAVWHTMSRPITMGQCRRMTMGRIGVHPIYLEKTGIVISKSNNFLGISKERYHLTMLFDCINIKGHRQKNTTNNSSLDYLSVACTRTMRILIRLHV